MDKIRTAWNELYGNKLRFYLPDYTKLLRNIENIFSNYLDDQGFDECLFPKLLSIDQFLKLKNALPRFGKEWSNEVFSVSGPNQLLPTFTLTHWQCEPFYFYLKGRNLKQTTKYYDKSGWSYRCEDEINEFRLMEFLRIESVWYAESDEALRLFSTLLSGISEIISGFDLETRIIKKVDEENETGEIIVKDVEVYVNDFGWIEVAGFHLHGSLILDALLIDNEGLFYTGCCGIATSRLANILFKKLN